jgi:hypothetical protein
VCAIRRTVRDPRQEAEKEPLYSCLRHHDPITQHCFAVQAYSKSRNN